jgi:hypothetical protein
MLLNSNKKLKEKEWRLKNKDKVKQYFQKWFLKNKDYYIKYKQTKKCKLYDKEYRLKNKDKLSQNQKEFRLNNKDKVRKTKKLYNLNNPHTQRAITAKYRASQLKATPKFADLNKIKEIYKNCPKGYTVDHIVPLQGKNVCGLHVHWNMQYLTRSENSSKSNKLL